MINTKELTNKILEREKENKKIAENISIKKQKISKSVLNGKIAGVDGGLVKKDFHISDIIFRRAVSTIFTYENNVLVNTEYYPNLSEIQSIMYNRDDSTDFANLKRVELELTIAIETIKKFKPDLILLDGSIVPHPSLRVSKESELYPEYENIKDLYKRLYELSKETQIAGVVEDSRSRKISEKNNCHLRDTHLLFYLLDKGERTEIFDYHDIENKETKMETIQKWPIKSCYMKTVENDRPIRVDFLSNNPEETLSKIYSMCCFKDYGIPSILIEADKRAKISNLNIDIPNILFNLRRNKRPL